MRLKTKLVIATTMLTFAIGAIAQDYPENLGDVGFFAMPGDDAAKNGLTVWMPATK